MHPVALADRRVDEVQCWRGLPHSLRFPPPSVLQAIDKRLGYEKRFDKTKEDFRTKEKRKRAMGQQSSGKDWVQEEKRRLRQGMTGNYDS